ncbi:hypothetical protein Cantr_06729 [Candida viswanathii]|uniref:Uncharacterized protein n=1 Tax=Candida viswanathii TaxID=5486 RepID=A0A367XW68_9ASCO|nr:hypothetical protein Cantr_06729 [Candida viswanathii]
MKYPKREINSEPFKSQLDIIEKITIEIKHLSNNPIFKYNHRYSTNNATTPTLTPLHHNNYNNRYNNNTSQYVNNYNNTIFAPPVQSEYLKTDGRVNDGDKLLLDKLFDPFKPVELVGGGAYGSMNNNIWSSRNNNGSNGNCIY